MTDTTLVYFGESAPNGVPLSRTDLDILRIAMEIAYEDEDNYKDFHDPEAVERLRSKIMEAYEVVTA